MGHVLTPDAMGVAVVGTTVYGADGVHGLLAYDVANPPSRPTLLGTAAFPQLLGMVADGNEVYLVDGLGTLRAIDAANPTIRLEVQQMITWDPFRDVATLRQEIDRAFEQAGLGPLTPSRPAFLPGHAARQYPFVNLFDDESNLYVEALAPGVAPDAFEISVAGRTLTIAGEKPGLADVPLERIHRTERETGRFLRTVELPAEIDSGKVSARYEQGLLLLTLPRAGAAQPRRTAVQTN